MGTEAAPKTHRDNHISSVYAVHHPCPFKFSQI